MCDPEGREQSITKKDYKCISHGQVKLRQKSAEKLLMKDKDDLCHSTNYGM